MRAALSRWTFSIAALCLPLVALMACDNNGDHHGSDFNVDSILAIIYAVGDVVISIIQAATAQ
jgi:hypothetical protein